MMVNQTGNRIHRHRTCSPVLDVNISKKLIADAGSNSKHTIHVCLILTNPRIRKHRQRRIIISQMPNIKRLRVLGTHLTSYTRGLITVISPRFLITENLVINDSTGRILNARALGKNLLVLHGLLTDVRKNRPVVIKAILTRPETFKTLLIGMIVTSDHNTNIMTSRHLLAYFVCWQWWVLCGICISFPLFPNGWYTPFPLSGACVRHW